MEESGAMVAKKVWSMVRALYFMLRKDKFNKKMMLDIKMMMKRGKLARKASHNLMLHHQDKDTNVDSHLQYLSSNALPGEYIFSCSNTPLFRLNRSRNGRNSRRFFSCAHATPTLEDGDEMSVNIAMMKALEMLKCDHDAPPGSGRSTSPVVRITDSPYPPIHEVRENNHVDEAAEEFIKKFYKDLKKQST